MSRIAYSVIATFPDPRMVPEYIAWLRSGHVDAVLRAGAESGLIIRITDPASPAQVETRYVFPSRGVLDRYVAQVAPALRADGADRFGSRGVTFARRIGDLA